MNRKWLLGIILVLTVLVVITIVVLTSNTKYNKLIINEDKWNDIISDKNMTTSISLENIKFNDYDLLIDEDNSIIYYSVVNVKNKYNPSVNYSLKDNKLKIAINKEMSDESLEKTDDLKIMLYDDTSYRTYSLVVTSYPILNVTYTGEENKKKTDIDIYLFDNHIDSPGRVLKSDGKLKIIEDNQEYNLSLKKESLGHNKRDNYMSIFGMSKIDEYVLTATDKIDENKKYVQFFINNNYKGIYLFEPKEGRREDNFERNKENNK